MGAGLWPRGAALGARGRLCSGLCHWRWLGCIAGGMVVIMTPQQLNAMKLALEALELVNVEFVCGNGSHHKKEDRHEWDEDCPITNRWRKAITAIKEALAEHAMREVQRLGQEIEQEPVAWMHTKLDGVVVPHQPADLSRHPDRWEALYKTPPPCPTCEALARTVMMDQTGRDA